jgi:hypothetical protein
VTIPIEGNTIFGKNCQWSLYLYDEHCDAKY